MALLTLVVADRYLVRRHAAPGLRATALIGLVIVSPLPGLVLLGMEHILHILVTIWFAGAAIDALCEESAAQNTSTRDTAILSALGALLVTSRYEGLFLVAIVSVAFAIKGRWARGLVVGVVSVVPAVLFGLVSMTNGWLFFQNSLLLKAGGANVSIVTALSSRTFTIGSLLIVPRSRFSRSAGVG
ncbi:MAG: hypothetical protein ACRD2N_22020 [Vicinamibacterales bacterium]